MKFARLILTSLAVLFVSVPALAQWVDDRQPARDSLKGLDRMVVKVDLSTMDALLDDPTEREVQKSVEKRLRDAGIRIVERPWGTSDSFPTLSVSLSFMNFDIFYHQLYISVALRQEVRLATNPSLKLTATT